MHLSVFFIYKSAPDSTSTVRTWPALISSTVTIGAGTLATASAVISANSLVFKACVFTACETIPPPWKNEGVLDVENYKKQQFQS